MYFPRVSLLIFCLVKSSKDVLLLTVRVQDKIEMNIDNLLKKLDDDPKQALNSNASDNNKNGHKTNKPIRTLVNDGKYYQHSDANNLERNIKTWESIGTVNSQPDNNEQSFVVPDSVIRDKLGIKNGNGLKSIKKISSNFDVNEEVHTPRQRKAGRDGTENKSSKLDEELTKIEKMKNLYESRQNRSLSKSNNKTNRSLSMLSKLPTNNHFLKHPDQNYTVNSIEHSDLNENSFKTNSKGQRSSSCSKVKSYSNSQQKLVSNNKKHTLRPSCTPSFNKFVANVKEQAHKAVRNEEVGKIHHRSCEEQSDAELCRNIYLEQFLANSENENVIKKKKEIEGTDKPKDSKKHAYHKYQQSQQQICEEFEHQLTPLQQSERGQKYQSSRYLISPDHRHAQNSKQGEILTIDKPNSTRNPQKPYKNDTQRQSYQNTGNFHQKPEHELQKQIENMYLSFDQNNASSFIQHPQNDESSCNIERFISPQTVIKNITNNTPVSNFNNFLSNQKNQLSNEQQESSNSSRKNKHDNDITRSEMFELIRVLNQKYEQLEEEICLLRNQNRQFAKFKREVQEKMSETNQQNMHLKQMLYQKDEEKNQLQLLVDQGKRQKQQLEEMVKDVLYQREKQKMQKASRENSSRENLATHKNSKQNIFLQNTQAQTHHFRDSSEYSMKNHRQSGPTKSQSNGNKMKVQNLLQKLHIKVDRA